MKTSKYKAIIEKMEVELKHSKVFFKFTLNMTSSGCKVEVGVVGYTDKVWAWEFQDPEVGLLVHKLDLFSEVAHKVEEILEKVVKGVDLEVVSK